MAGAHVKVTAHDVLGELEVRRIQRGHVDDDRGERAVRGDRDHRLKAGRLPSEALDDVVAVVDVTP